MGISQHVLSLLEKNNKRMACADSSEIEEQQKDRCKLLSSINQIYNNEYASNKKHIWNFFVITVYMKRAIFYLQIFKTPVPSFFNCFYIYVVKNGVHSN